MLKRALPLFAVAIVELAILIGAGIHQDQQKPLTPAQKRAKRARVGGPFPLELRSPQVVAGTSVRVLVALGRPSLAELNAKTPQTLIRQRAYVRSLHHEERALMSALEAKGVRFGQPIVFARVWSGFAATLATKDLPAVQTLGLRVEPVDRFYPAQVPARDAPAVRPLPTTATHSGPVAVLDAFPRSRWAIDFVGRVGNGHRSAAEDAGLRVGAIVHRELSAAPVMRYRVAGSQALENGRFEVFGTTDQILAGLERVVDPDQNGDASDAAPVAVTGLSAPYSGFGDSDVAQAVDGAAELGTLVVAAAGNGGDPVGPFGSIGDPGAAGGVLAVGALNTAGDPATASSTGPTYDYQPKPDLAISGGAKTARGTAWGTAIAAARVAGVAAALRAERPNLTAAEAASALVGTAAPRGAPDAAGGGDPLLQAARVAPFVAQPAQVAIQPGETVGVRIKPATAASAQTTAAALAADAPAAAKSSSLGIRVSGRRGHQVVFITAPSGARDSSGRIDFGPVAIPFQVLATPPPMPPLGRPRVILSKGKPDGVRFVAGSISRGDKGTSVIPVGNLVLTLSGPSKRELTPPGGARNLLPGEYAYTLTDEIKAQLTPGRYRFVLRARGTAGGPPVVRHSRSFRVA